VKDFSPLKDVPVEELYCDYNLERDRKALRSIKTLAWINTSLAREVLGGD
jgi:hypothetical protein